MVPHLVLVDMPLVQVVYEIGDRLNHVYFPTISIISLLYAMEDGASGEIAIVGNEGIVGIALFMGGETTPSRAIDQQLCRCLLLSIDRLPPNELRMTQQLIANMLGVRRPGITEAAMKMQEAGLNLYSYGHIEVLNRPGLEQRVCECYAVVKCEFDRLPPDLRRL